MLSKEILTLIDTACIAQEKKNAIKDFAKSWLQEKGEKQLKGIVTLLVRSCEPKNISINLN